MCFCHTRGFKGVSMSIIIRSSGISEVNNTIGYIEHAVMAASACLNNSTTGLDEIDLLVNVGNYRDNNLCEPSVAALIQHELGINLNPLKHPVKSHTFSFDLMNGACGMLSALQVVHAILHAKGLKRALIVSGDCHPSTKSSADFPIHHTGAALLLERSNVEGFSRFSFQTTSSFEGQSGYLDLDTHKLQSRYSVSLEDSTDTEHQFSFAKKVIQSHIEQHNIEPSSTKLLVSHHDASLVNRLGSTLGMTLASGMDSLLSIGNIHTAGLGFGLHKSIQELEQSDVLCVSIGSGVTVGCALYRQMVQS